MVSSLLNVSPELADAVAKGLGMPEIPAPMPKVLQRRVRPEVETSQALSLLARPGDGTIRTRRVAILVADGVEGRSLLRIHERLTEEGAVPRFVGGRLGAVSAGDGSLIEVDATLETTPSVLFDAVVLPDGTDAVEALAKDGHSLEFLRDQFRHCKTILAVGAGTRLLEKAAGKPKAGDSGVLRAPAGGDARILDDFVAAIAKHRHFARDADPPLA